MEAVMQFAKLTVLIACLLSPPTTATKTPPPSSSLQSMYPQLPNDQEAAEAPPPPESASRVTEVKSTYNAKNHNQPPLSKQLAKLLSEKPSHHMPSPSTPSSKLLTGHRQKDFQQDRHSSQPLPSKRPANPLSRNPFHHTETQSFPPPPQHEIRAPLEMDSNHPASSFLGGNFSGRELQRAVMVDGVPLSELPPHLILAAYLREKALRRMSRSGSSSVQSGKLLRVRSSVMATTASGLDATAFCQTEECVKLMQEYEQWRRQNGYGTSGGRWG